MSAQEYQQHIQGQSKPNKYGAVKTEYKGRMYDSKKEARYAEKLDMMFLSGEVIDWKPQVRIPLTVNGKKICTYVCDFLVVYADGRIEYVDTKGVRTATYKLKAKLVKALLGVEIKEV